MPDDNDCWAVVGLVLPGREAEIGRNDCLSAMARQLVVHVKEAEALGEYHLAAHLIEALHEAKRCEAGPKASGPYHGRRLEGLTSARLAIGSLGASAGAVSRCNQRR